MSDTVSSGTSVVITEPKPADLPLVSSSYANQGTAAGSSGAAAAAVIILVWLLGLVHLQVPTEVSVAFSALITAGVHWLVLKYGVPNSK